MTDRASGVRDDWDSPCAQHEEKNHAVSLELRGLGRNVKIA